MHGFCLMKLELLGVDFLAGFIWLMHSDSLLVHLVVDW
jgi:hypothetical protein